MRTQRDMTPASLRMAAPLLLLACGVQASVLDIAPTRLHRPVTGLNGSNDGFATSMVRIGDVVLVGAPQDRVGTGDTTGTLYAFQRIGTEWELTGALSPDGACGFPSLPVATGDHAFALSSPMPCHAVNGAVLHRVELDATSQPVVVAQRTVELDGHAVVPSDLDSDGSSVAVMAAPRDGGTQSVLVYDADLQHPPQRLAEPDASIDFSLSVAVQEHWLAAACFEDEVIDSRQRGCVQMFHRTGVGAMWLPAGVLVIPEGVDPYTFGSDLRFAAGRLFVGVYGYRWSKPLPGAVVEYELVADTWQPRSVIAPDNGLPGDQFGRRIEADDGELFVHAPERRADPGYRRPGALYRYCNVAGNWTPCGFREASVGDEDWPRPEAVAAFDDELLFAKPYFHNPEDGSQGTVARVTRDSALTETGHFHPGDGGGDMDRFGATVATDGDLLAVGAPGHRTGAVFVYRRSRDGWQHETTLFGEYIGPDCPGFGSALVVRNGTVAVTNGCPDEDADAQGYIHYFRRSDEGWSETRHRVPATDENLGFGNSLVLTGREVIYGTPLARISGAEAAGAVHVLKGLALGYMDIVVHAPVLSVDGQFGRHIAALPPTQPITGDSVLLLAIAGASPRVELFEMEPLDYYEAEHVATLASSEPDAPGEFGTSLAMDATSVLVGAPGAHCPPGSGAGGGALYRYARVDGVWALTQRVCPDQEGQRFGAGLALHGNTAIVSSIGSFGVRMHEYAVSAQGLDAVATHDDVRPGAWGFPLALSAETFVAGAPLAVHPVTFTTPGAVDVRDIGALFDDDFEIH